MDLTDIDKLISDRDAFNAFIYTPLDEALRQLKERANNSQIAKHLGTQQPSIFGEPSDKKWAVLFRHVATPNYELRRFVSIVEAIPELTPVVIEYHHDRFTNRNECKFALGKVCFNIGKSKDGKLIFTFKNIIDVNDANKKKISEIATHWGEDLIAFHHEFLRKEYLDKIATPVSFFDASEWIQQAGKSPQKYYEAFLSLFLKDAILFENFLLDQKESTFTREVILPAFIKITETTGVKPLIVALAPTDIEGDKFWLSYPEDSLQYLNSKLSSQ